MEHESKVRGWEVWIEYYWPESEYVGRFDTREEAQKVAEEVYQEEKADIRIVIVRPGERAGAEKGGADA